MTTALPNVNRDDAVHAESFSFTSLFFQNTIEGRLVYFPIVGRLSCDSTYVDHHGYWETIGYGLLSIYKSDWMRFGGKRDKKILSNIFFLKTYKRKNILPNFSVTSFFFPYIKFFTSFEHSECWWYGGLNS